MLRSGFMIGHSDNIAAAKAVYREFLYIMDGFEREKIFFSGFLIFLIGFLGPGGLPK